jgi:type I restriction enzyme R subunit
VIGTNEAIVKEFMDNCLLDETGTLPAKSILFAVSKKHAKRVWEAFEKLYPEYKGKLTRIVVSDDPRAQQLIRQFKTETWPRIAISVDMLDTGIDVPEVCNLAFIKPVFSRIKFWQMIGRGTRSNAVCTHKEWLPDGRKENFLIFDFWNNFEWFNMHPKGRVAKLSEAIPAKIFLTKLLQYKYFSSKKDKNNIGLLREKIVDDIKKLPKESISVRENIRDVELALSPKMWDRVGLKPLEFLRKKITPLMRFQKNVNLNEASFTLKTEKLALAILTKDENQFERLKEDIGEMLNCLPTTIKEVKEKSDLLDKVLSSHFWKDVKFEDTLMIQQEFAPLMKYKRAEPRAPIVLDIDDIVQKRRMIEYGPAVAPLHEYAETYMDKVEKKIKELADKHPTIQKIKRDEVITEKDLEKLEEALNSPELYITEEVLKNLFNQHKGTLVQFIMKIIGLYEFPDPRKKIEEAFKTFLIEKNYLNADQVNFIRTIQTVFLSKHHIEYKDFFEPPFTNFGVNAPIPLMQENELKEIVFICRNLEGEFFSKP